MSATPAALWDIIVIGAGTAGLPLAIFASRRGARVLLIDAAPVVGGTMHLANGQVAGGGTRIQDAKGIIDSPDRHYDDIMRITHGLANPAVVRLTANQAPATLNWLLDAGLTPLADHPVTGNSPGRPAYSTPRYFWGENQGRDILAVIEKELLPELQSGRVVTQLNTRVTALMISSTGAVEGVRATAGGKPFEARGRHVVITTGGYAMNPAFFERLIGKPAYGAGSYPFCQGDGLEMATAAGAVLRGQDLHRSGTGSILTAEKFPAQVYARFNTVPQTRAPWEIWVNNAGHRFIREDEPVTYLRDRALQDQPALRYAIVFDDAIFQEASPGIPGWSREKMLAHFDSHPMFLRAETLDALAQKASIDAVGLLETVRTYNATVAGAEDFLGREHSPRAIQNGPYYAIIHLGHSATSSTGLVVDRDLRVLRSDGTAIPGLYAAGEVLGSGATLGDAFAPGMMLTPALALGHLLGERLALI